MTHDDFEKLLNRRAEEIYQRDKMILLKEISDYFNNRFRHMNAHESGNSLVWETDKVVNTKIEERKAVIIKTIKQNEMDRILGSLESVRFLFEVNND